MSLHDSLFLEDAEEDVRHFLENDARKRVLVFPPVNNYRRFLVHQLVQEQFGDRLHTFSIGQGLDRRTVVCYKSDFIGTLQVNGTQSTAANLDRKPFSTMGIESQCTPGTSPEHSARRQRQVKSVPSVEIYVPPALRRVRSEKSPGQSVPAESPVATPKACPKANRQKRPDRAVYVPRHRRGLPEAAEAGNATEPQAKPSRESRIASKRPVDRTTGVAKPVESTIASPVKAQLLSDTQDSSDAETVELAPPAEATSASETMELENVASEELKQDNPLEEAKEEDQLEKMEEEEHCEQQSNLQPIDEPTALVHSPIKNEELNEDVGKPQSDTRERRKSAESNSPGNIEPETNGTCPGIIDATSESTTSAKSQAPKKAPVSRVLVISAAEQTQQDAETRKEEDQIAPVPMTPPEKKVKKIERPKSKPAAPPAPPVKVNRDECDWDSLFDDNGDCLDPTLIEELTCSVGEVVIEKPKSSYKSFTRPVEVSSDEFGHVLEIYNFPSDFKTSDLAAVFSPFKAQGFELKWVDDTHCLAVFSSPLVAAEVLASDHPFVKTRPLSEATAMSKTKARKSSEFLQPFRTRPETCAALARRLVTKSLGVTLATARQEREQEKIVLREAKEKKRLANKQRQEIWEGVVAPKPTL